jgi:hypothetical protein
MAHGGQPKTYIYHITPVDNLSGIIGAGELLSDRLVRASRPHVNIGYSHIKERRLRTGVPCCPGKTVGDFVPFNFCPRAVMLHLIHLGNPELTYRGGQKPIVHLASSVELAVEAGLPCVYTEANASTSYTRFHTDLDQLTATLNWDAIQTTDFRDRAAKDGNQAEFLVGDRFPFGLIRAIGVQNSTVKEQVELLLADVPEPPSVRLRPKWYY